MPLTPQYIALQNNADGTGPLASYFQGEDLSTGKADTFTANMYVAPLDDSPTFADQF